MYLCESQKYDMEFEVRKRDFEVLDWELTPFRKKTLQPPFKSMQYCGRGCICPHLSSPDFLLVTPQNSSLISLRNAPY